MTRYWFGGGVADWTFTTQDGVGGFDDIAQVVGGATVTFWNSETGGTQHTDLLDVDGAAVTAVASSDGADGRAAGTIPPFQGPDEVTELWAEAGGGPRSRLVAVGYALPLSGGTLTGPLTLSGPPTSDLHAVTKSYVDTAGGGNTPSVVNVVGYGAVGDGATDDTTAIQNAIAAAEATPGGSAVYFPPGKTFRVTAPLTINPWRCSLTGAGPAHSVLEFSGLAAGQYAITYQFVVGAEPAPKHTPFRGARDLTIRESAPYSGACHGIRMGTDAAGVDAWGITFDHVTIEGFADQVTYRSRSYISSWNNCHFFAAQSRGVVLPSSNVTAGERINFVSCLFSDSPGTLVEIATSGTDAYFYGCSFDYSGRALNLLAGQAHFFGCHFETDNTYAASFDEYILVNRNGSVPLPQLLISGGMFFPWWTNYDTAIRVTGTTFGEAVVAVRDVRVFSDATTTCPYLIRDDGSSAATVTYSGITFSDTTQALPKYRTQAGVDLPITHAGQPFGPKAPRLTRRTYLTALEPIPADRASASNALVSGTIYHLYFCPTEDIDINKVGLFVAGTAAAANSLAKAAVYRSGAGGTLTRLAQSAGTAFGTVTFNRADAPLTSVATCRAGQVYTLSLLFVGGTMPAIATVPNGGGYILASSTYGHPICQQTTGQTDMPPSIAAGSLGAGSVLPYLVGSSI